MFLCYHKNCPYYYNHLNSSRVSFPKSYDTYDYIANGNKNIIQAFEIPIDCYIVAYVRTQSNSGDCFMRISSSNGNTIYEGQIKTKNTYQYLWSSLIPVKAKTTLRFDIETSSNNNDAQIAIKYYPL